MGLMKRNILYMAGALLSSAILAFGCSDDIPSYREMAIDKAEVFIQADGDNPTAAVNITSGNGNYKVTVADENIATATINGTQIIVNGLKNGLTTATVMDWAKQSTVFTIKVKEDFDLELDKTELYMFLGENENELINITSGNGGYQVESSDDNVATAEIVEEKKISITAQASGFCNVITTDADGKKTTLKVIVCEHHLVLEDITGRAWLIGQTANIAITSGNGEYTVASENEEIATAEITDDAITVTGIAKGETTVTITDKMGLTASAKVKVSAGLEIATTHIDNIWIGEEAQEIVITDGSGNYTINAGEFIKYTLSKDNSKIMIEGISEKIALNQTIKITDNAFNQTQNITVGEVNYRFEEYGKARWYVKGILSVIPYSYIATEGSREHIKVGTAKASTNNNALNGYHLSFEGGRGEGPKTSPVIYTTKGSSFIGSGGDDKSFTITDLEIVKREYTKPEDETNGKGKYWIRFKEEGKEEYSYIITWF